MEVIAYLKNLRIAPRKLRLLAPLVTGRPVSEAMAELEFRAKRGALPIKKLIQSAVANAKHNYKLDHKDLVVKSMIVNSSTTLKRYMPRAFGRAALIRKRGSNITVVLTDKLNELQKKTK